MPRRDQLTYDVGPPPRRRVPGLPMLLLAAVVAVGSVLVTLVVVDDGEPEAVPTPISTGSVIRTVEASTGSPVPSGSDAGDGLAVPEGSQQAASRFVAAWLDRNPQTRKAALEEVSAPALVEELLLTDPANIPRAVPRGDPVLDDASVYSVQFTQALTGGVRIAVYLVFDPEARYQWLATSVERA